jgi:hypothetical protein
MGTYINPPNKTKEEFLKEHGTPISLKSFKEKNFEAVKEEGNYYVILVDNGPFKAALVCDGQREYTLRLNELDLESRPYLIYTAPIEKVDNVTG